jgi:RNA methyltransferase, TrmH family
MIDVISSKDNFKVKRAYLALNGKGERFVVEGFHLVEMALSAGAVEEIFTLKNYEASVPVHMVDEAIIKKLSATKTPEGIVALVRKPLPQPFSCSRLLFLDEVGDPGNVGALLRSALAFGWKDVLVSKGSAEVYASKTLLASQGAIFFLNVVRSKETPLEDIAMLKKLGYFILGTDLRSPIPLRKLSLVSTKIALILGNEAHGVGPELLANSDRNVRIEMSGIDSLNVAMAGGILMYELQAKTGEAN